MNKELQVVLPDNALDVYSCDKIDDLITKIEDHARSIVPDLSTDKGRKAIASNAASVARSKTALDKLGKELVSGWKDKAKVVDIERKSMRDRLDALRDEVRDPLTKWDAEQIEIAVAKLAAKKLIEKHVEALDLNSLFDRERFLAAREAALAVQEKERQARIKAEEKERADAAAKEYAKQAEKERIERVEADKAKAVQQAIFDAEQREIEAAELAERNEAEAAAAIEAAELEAEEAKQREADAIANAEIVRENAETSRKKAAEDARQKLIREQADEAERIEQETARREANMRHVGKIRGEAKDDLVVLGLPNDLAKAVVLAIAKGNIKNVTITY